MCVSLDVRSDGKDTTRRFACIRFSRLVGARGAATPRAKAATFLTFSRSIIGLMLVRYGAAFSPGRCADVAMS